MCRNRVLIRLPKVYYVGYTIGRGEKEEFCEFTFEAMTDKEAVRRLEAIKATAWIMGHADYHVRSAFEDN